MRPRKKKTCDRRERGEDEGRFLISDEGGKAVPSRRPSCYLAEGGKESNSEGGREEGALALALPSLFLTGWGGGKKEKEAVNYSFPFMSLRKGGILHKKGGKGEKGQAEPVSGSNFLGHVEKEKKRRTGTS